MSDWWWNLTASSCVSMVVSTLVLTPIILCVYHVVVFFADIRRRGRAVDKFPSDPKHWLWGHLHIVSYLNE